MSELTNPKRSMMEKYAAQTIQGLILAALLGSGSLLMSQNQIINSMDKNITVLQIRVQTLSESQNSYLTKADADQRGKTRDIQIEAIRNDISGLKSDIVDIKRRVFKN